jgi:hypothetical protein
VFTIHRLLDGEFISTAERWDWSRGLMSARKNAVSAKTAFIGYGEP